MHKNKKNKKQPNGRSSARLAAVQSLYILKQNEEYNIENILRDFVNTKIGSIAIDEDPITEDEEIVDITPMDKDLYLKLVRGAHAQLERIDEVIRGSLMEEWSEERMEPVVHSILRAGIYELMEFPKTPVKVIISEYVDIAYSFYRDAEPKMVNAVMDRLAKTLRSEELN